MIRHTVAMLTILVLATSTAFASTVRRIASDDGKRAIEVLTGDAARAHVDELTPRQRAAIGKGLARLKEKGYARADAIVVVRMIDLHAEARRSAEVRPVTEEYYSDSEGEMIVTSGDDGDDVTWEGSIYSTIYSSGAYAVVNGQVLTEDAAPVWEETVEYYGGGGGGPGGEYMTSLESPKPAQVASLFADLGFAVNRDMGEGRTLLVQLVRRMRNFSDCLVSTCPSFLGYCRFSGPLWIGCAMGACGMGGVRCGHELAH